MRNFSLLINLSIFFYLAQSKTMHVLTNQIQAPQMIQQPSTIQMSSLSLMGNTATNTQPYLELTSMPDGVGKLMVGHSSVSEGLALRFLFNDQVVMQLNSRSITTSAETFNLQNIRFGGSLYYASQPQWRLTVNEQFWSAPIGWSDTSISTCGGINMLGGWGKFAGGEVQKQFENLSEHKYLKIVANYHFIDAWSGESGFMRANIGRDNQMEYLWTEKYDYSKSKNGLNICGSAYPEGKLTSKIEVTIPHTSDSIILGFGSTLDQDAEENSFGISNLQIYSI